jgi:GGDEF domain-containing protein
LHGQELIRHADRALYQAKHRDGDLAVIYEDWMVEPAHSDGLEINPPDSHLPKEQNPK